MKIKLLLVSSILFAACSTERVQDKVKLITLDPGHFHAALIQKSMYPEVDTNVHVYAAEGRDLQLHMDRINGYNNRDENPTTWNQTVYTGNDFFDKIIAEKKRQRRSIGREQQTQNRLYPDIG